MSSNDETHGKDVPSTATNLQPDVARAAEATLRDDPDARATFLASFTAEDEKRIMKKVDRRFLILIGLMYMVKQVSLQPGTPLFAVVWKLVDCVYTDKACGGIDRRE